MVDSFLYPRVSNYQEMYLYAEQSLEEGEELVLCKYLYTKYKRQV